MPLLPRRRTVAWAALAGLGVAALDLRLIGRRFPGIRALVQLPQVADHLPYGATVGAVLSARRGGSRDVARQAPGHDGARQVRVQPAGEGGRGDRFPAKLHGRGAGYVRNIEANPAVRINVGRRWRLGTAHLMPGEDPRERQRRTGRRLNAAAVRAMGTELLSVRVDLDPE